MAKEKSKEIEMSTKEEKKLSYEELEQIAGNLNQQCRQMQSQIRSMQNAIAEFNEIGMMLDILDKSEHFHEEFIQRCADKVEELVSKAMDTSEKAEKEGESN